MHIKRSLWAFTISISGATGSMAQEDMAGSTDHPYFPRLPGASIATYHYGEEGYGSHIEGIDLSITEHYLEGEVTKLLYLLPERQSAVLATAEYLEIFAEVGTFGAVCGREVTRFLQWPSPNNRSPTPVRTPDERIIPLPDFILRYPQRHDNITYISGEIRTNSDTYTISLYTAENRIGAGAFGDGQAFVDLQIVTNGKSVE